MKSKWSPGWIVFLFFTSLHLILFVVALCWREHTSHKRSGGVTSHVGNLQDGLREQPSTVSISGDELLVQEFRRVCEQEDLKGRASLQSVALNPVERSSGIKDIPVKIVATVGNAQATEPAFVKPELVAGYSPMRVDHLEDANDVIGAFGVQIRSSTFRLLPAADKARVTRALDRLALQDPEKINEMLTELGDIAAGRTLTEASSYMSAQDAANLLNAAPSTQSFVPAHLKDILNGYRRDLEVFTLKLGYSPIHEGHQIVAYGVIRAEWVVDHWRIIEHSWKEGGTELAALGSSSSGSDLLDIESDEARTQAHSLNERWTKIMAETAKWKAELAKTSDNKSGNPVPGTLETMPADMENGPGANAFTQALETLPGKGDRVELIRDEPLQFRGGKYRDGMTGDIFTVLDVRPTEKRIYLLAKGNDGSNIALNVASDSVKIIDSAIGRYNGQIRALFAQKNYAGAWRAAEQAQRETGNVNKYAEVGSALRTLIAESDGLARAKAALVQARSEASRMKNNARVVDRPNALNISDTSNQDRARTMRDRADAMIADSESASRDVTQSVEQARSAVETLIQAL